MKTIVLGIDLKDNTLKLCKEAILYALKLKASITLVHAVEFTPYYPYFPYDQSKIDDFHSDKISNEIKRLEAYLNIYDVKVETPVIRQGNTHEVLCEVANEVNAAAILIGVGQHFIFENITGTTTEKVSRLASQKVIILNHCNQSKVDTVLSAFDFSDNSHLALESAVRFCLFFKSDLIVAHVCKSDFNEDIVRGQIKMRVEEIIRSQKNTFEDEEPVNFRIVLVKGNTVSQLINLIHETGADILSIGPSGHNSFQHFFIGSTVSKIIRKAPCTIVVTPKTAVAQVNSRKDSA